MSQMRTEASNSEFRDQLVRYLAGEMAVEEREQFEQELHADPEKQQLHDEYVSIWQGVDRVAEQGKYDLDKEWEMFNEKVDIDAPPSRRLSRRSFMMRIAAAFLIGLAGIAGWLILKDQASFEQVAVESGTRVVELEDGTVITLNSGSTLKYNLDHSSGARKVALTGEAFFEVARDTSRPFVIEAGSALVEVLGTSFNVNAYSENDFVEVTVETGLVSMAARSDQSRHIILNPGNAGIYDRSERKLDLITRSDPNAVAWKTREIVFSETNLGEAIRVISHVYQVDFKLGNASLATCPITVTFRDQELGAVLSVIASTLDLQVERENGVIVLMGEGCTSPGNQE